MPRLVSARHELFAQGLAKGLSPEVAYARAGFKPHRQNAHRTMTRDDIKKRVAELQGEAAKHTVMTLGEVLKELEHIARARMNKVASWRGQVSAERAEAAEDGDATEYVGGARVDVIDSDLIDDATHAAIAEVSQTKDGIRIKMHPKLPALVKLLECKLAEQDLLRATAPPEPAQPASSENVVDFKAMVAKFGK